MWAAAGIGGSPYLAVGATAGLPRRSVDKPGRPATPIAARVGVLARRARDQHGCQDSTTGSPTRSSTRPPPPTPSESTRARPRIRAGSRQPSTTAAAGRSDPGPRGPATYCKARSRRPGSPGHTRSRRAQPPSGDLPALFADRETAWPRSRSIASGHARAPAGEGHATFACCTACDPSAPIATKRARSNHCRPQLLRVTLIGASG